MTDPSRCPSPEQIAAFVAGSLSGDELMMVTEHIRTCGDCRLILADAAMIDREPEFAATAPSSPPRRGSHWWWLAAAAAVVIGVTLVWTRLPLGDRNDAMHRLIEASPSDGRYLEPRLSGGFAWAPILPVRRDSTQPLDPREMKLIGVAGEVLEQTAKDPSPEAQHAAALAHLLAGRPNEAASLLDALAASSKDAGIWSDLAAARYAAGIQSGQAQPFGQALAAADTALRFDPNLPEALFNRALTIERLGLRARAVAAWERYLAADGRSEWATEARKHLERLRGPSSSFQDELERDYARLIDDELFARAFAKRFPEDVRRWGETEILGRWAEALQNGDDREAAGHLAVARVFGDTLAAGGGDRILRDAVEAIDRSTPEQRRWLAEAHRQFRQAQRLLKTRDLMRAFLLFEQAAEELRRGGSPVALLARYFAAVVLYERGEIAQSRQRFEHLLAGAPLQYQAHRAQLQWQIGLLEGTVGQWGAAIRAYEDGVRGFDRLGETRNSAILRQYLSEVYDRTGDSQSAWGHRLIAWQELGRKEDLRLQNAVQTAARAAALEDHWPASLAFLDLAVSMSPADGTDSLRFRTLLFRARVRGRLGQSDGAASDLARAAVVLKQIKDPDTHALAEADRLAVTGFLAPTPFVAVPSLTRAIEFHRGKGRRMYLPELYLERGRAYAKMRDVPAAAADFEAGIGELESQRLSLRAGDERWGMFSSYGELFDEAVGLALARGDVEQAFAYSERARARELLDSLGTSNEIVAVAAPVPLHSMAGVVMIEYATLPESLVMFVIDHQKQLRVIQTSVSRAILMRDVGVLVESAMNDDAERFRGAASALYARLLQPAAGVLSEGQRLVIVPDAVLSTVPFAALLDPAGKYVIERYSVVIAPSAAVFARLASRPQPAPREPHLLLISGPAGREGDVRQLTNAQREASAVTAAYHHVPDVVSDDRNAGTFETRATNADVIHFVGHAELPGAGRGGALVTSRGSLDVRRIAAMRLQRTRVVILAACGTARGQHRGGEESISIARAFLAAGTPSVVATLWPIDDDPAAEFFPRLHHYLARGFAPADAVRATQLEWIQKGDAPPGLWAAVQTIGI